MHSTRACQAWAWQVLASAAAGCVAELAPSTLMHTFSNICAQGRADVAGHVRVTARRPRRRAGVGRGEGRAADRHSLRPRRGTVFSYIWTVHERGRAWLLVVGLRPRMVWLSAPTSGAAAHSWRADGSATAV